MLRAKSYSIFSGARGKGRTYTLRGLNPPPLQLGYTRKMDLLPGYDPRSPSYQLGATTIEL